MASLKPAKRSERARFSFETLEPRLLYSADFGPSLLAAPLAPTSAEERVLATELVFVDAATPNADELIADLAVQSGRAIEVVRIGADEDGLERIGAELALRQDIAAVHILAHGADGAVYLGRSVLDMNALEARAAELASWGAALTAEADLLIYGCDVAATDAGRAMLDRLAALTGADVAASDDPTGSAALGGDWNLEYATAAIEAHLALSQEAQDEWFGLLAVANVSASQDTYIVSSTGNNYGTATQLIVDASGGGVGSQRLLLQFDLSGIPAGATINSATLQLQATAISTAMNIEVYELTEGWSEGIGLGLPGAANWNDRALLTPWSSSGGTFNPVAVASINTDAVGQHSWSITSLVQAWINGTKTNNGVLLGSSDAGGATVTYDSRQTMAGTVPVLVIDYTPNNTAPALDASKTPVLSSVNEDAGAPSGAVGTLISGLVDYSAPAGQVDNVSDADAGAQLGIAVTGADAANGSWWYSTNGGLNWSALGAVSDTTARLLAADADTRIYFQPSPDYNGSIAAALTFRAWDQTDGTNGGTADTSANGGATAFSSATDTAGITVNSVNDAPAGSSTTVTTLEDTAHVFAAGDFGFSDTDGNALAAVRISTLPGAGTLTNNGAAVTAGQFVSAADIAAGLLRFTPGTNANGAAYASFTFQVQDDGGTANGGASLDPTARTLTVDVTAVNDAPVGASATVTVLEENAHVFAAADFGFSDIDGDVLAAVRIGTLPGAGTLTNNGVAVTAGQSISAADIAAGRLVFTPAANASGAGYASFTFQVQDDGGTANGGVDLDPTARTLTIDVTPVNDAPAGASATVSMLEDGAYVFAAGDFGFGDSDGNALAAVRIASLPGAGTLNNNGVAVTAGQSISAADIAAGRLVFTPASNASGAGYASFTFQVQDDGGTANGGVDLDPVARTLTVDVTAVNDAPAGTSAIVSVLEDGAYVFAAADFGFGDAEGDALAAVRISTLPSAGSLTNNGAAVGAGQFIAAADIAAGRLVFTPAADASGAGYASFTFQVQDDGGTANGGANLDPTARTLTIDVTAVNDAPAGTSGTVTLLEDGAHVFAAADFGFSDADGNALAAVRVSTLTTAGTLTVNGIAVTAGQSVSAADIAAGRLVFAPAANANGAGYASFGFQLQDDGGTANGGADLDPTARTLTFDVTPVNDAPAGADGSVSALQDTIYVFRTTDFGFSDADGNALAGVRIASLPAAGSLTENGSPVAAGQTVSALSISLGLLRFTPAAGGSGNAYASFSFQVLDDGGTANGGVDIDPVARAMTVDVAAAPVIALPSAPPLPPPVPEPEPPPPDNASTGPSTPAPASPFERAAETASVLLASEEVVITAEVDGGMRLPVLAEMSLTQNAAFVSSQRLEGPAPAALGLPGPVSLPDLAEKALELNLFGLQTVADGSGSSGARSGASFADDLDRMRDDVAEQAQLEQWVTGSVAAGSFGLTVGYVLWLLRGGALLASLLSSLPAWRLIDPLPVLARSDDDEGAEEDDDAFDSFLASAPAPALREEPS